MEVGLFLIHAVVGLLVAAHGTQKLWGWFGGHRLDGTAGYLKSLRLIPARPLASPPGPASGQRTPAGGRAAHAGRRGADCGDDAGRRARAAGRHVSVDHGRRLGVAFSHVGLINTAQNLTGGRGPAHHRRSA